LLFTYVHATGEHPELPALQKLKLINFFLCLWVIFALPDPDSDCKSGSGDPIESGSGSNAMPIGEGLFIVPGEAEAELVPYMAMKSSPRAGNHAYFLSSHS
jgi:hypothetical protein